MKMKANKRKAIPKYTIGPHGEIYNNRPVLSERSQNLLNAMILQDALEEAFKEEDVEDDGEGTTETRTEELHN